MLGYGPAALLDHLLALGHGGLVLGLALGHHGFILLALGFHLLLLFRLGGLGCGFVLLFLSGLDEARHAEVLRSGLLRRRSHLLMLREVGETLGRLAVAVREGTGINHAENKRNVAKPADLVGEGA